MDIGKLFIRRLRSRVIGSLLGPYFILCCSMVQVTNAGTICDSLNLIGLSSYPVADNPIQLESADLDGESGPDLVVLAQSSFSVLLTDAAGTPTSRVDYSIPPSPRVLAIGDIDGVDGPDLVIGYYSPRSFTVFLNDGVGGFSDSIQYSVDPSTYGVSTLCVVDFDAKDGLDVVASTGHTDLQIWLNNGSGELFRDSIVVTGTTFDRLVPVDFDFANGIDIAYSTGGSIGVFLNEGSGVLGVRRELYLTPAYDLQVADLDGYAGPDFVVVYGNSISILYNNGDTTLFPPLQFNVGIECFRAVIADSDGDSDLDVVSANRTDRSISILPNNGVGGFSSYTQFKTGEQPVDICSLDMDTDARIDFAIAFDRTDNLGLLMNTGSNTFYDAPLDFNLNCCGTPRDVVCAELDGANADDFLVMRSSNTCVMFRNNGDGSFLQYDDLSSDNAIAVFDADGVNGPDVVLGGSLRLFLNNGNGLYSGPYPIGNDFSNSILGADVDLDGRIDIVGTGGIDVFVYRNDGDSTFSFMGRFAAGTTPYAIASGEIDSTNGPDVSVLNGGNGISVLLNDGSGGFPSYTTYAAGANPSAVALADIDSKDGPDLSIVNQSGGGRVSTRFNTGQGTFGPPVHFPVPGLVQDVWAGNLDGKTGIDLAVTVLSHDHVRILLNDGAGHLVSGGDFQVGWQPYHVTGGNLDNIGADDLVVANTSSNTVVVLYNVTMPCCDCPDHADPQANGVIDVFDVVSAIDVIFRGAPSISDAGCLHGDIGRTDVNCDGVNNIFDVVSIIDVAFRGATPDFCNPCDCNPYPTVCP